ncbi:MAG: hypothetical protein DMF95_29445 [Acidobacteria bacterium]|nr:MAG: hypothetical protein DMF96_07705 [Acidobacteriota bacterium]PYR42014.1 MAG: hypothetical protein DMF95_29445 [Acidobacteriota bacterium]
MSSHRVNRREFLTLLAGSIAVPAKPFDTPLIVKLAPDGPFDSPLIVRLAQDGPFDSPLIVRLAQDRPFDSPLIVRLAQDGPFDSPLILSLSKDEPLAQDRPLPPVSWTCPMHPEVVDDRSGACPICRMPLTPVRLELVWSCQLHLDVTEPQPGACRTCGRKLVKIIKALSFTCPSHARVNEINPGKCPIDRRTLVAKYSLRPHGDHNPKHGGNFIMAPNNWHVEATHPAPSQFRLYVYDEYSRPFIPKGFASRIVMGEKSIPFKPAAGGMFLDARVPQIALPAAIVVGARFEDKQPEYRFDFQFYGYSKEPK